MGRALTALLRGLCAEVLSTARGEAERIYLKPLVPQNRTWLEFPISYTVRLILGT